MIIVFATTSISVNNLYNRIDFIIPTAFLILFVIYKIIFKEQIKVTLYKTFFISFLSILVEFILLIMLIGVTSSADALNDKPILKLFFTIVVALSLFVIFKLNLTKKLYLKGEELFVRSKRIIFISTFALIFLGYNYLLHTLDFSNMYFYLVSSTLMVLISLLSYYYFKQIYNNQLLKLKNDYLEENMELFKNTISDFRECRHNIINDFLFIKSLCDKEVQSLVTEKMEKYYKDYELIKDIGEIPKGFQGLIYVKSRMMKKHKIAFTISSNSLIDYKQMSYKLYIDLCEIIAITLDNAIEATHNADEKVIFFEIKSLGKEISIEIINTFSNDIDVNKLGNYGYSTKGRKSGIGLSYIQKLNRNIRIEKEVIHKMFKSKIFLQIK